MQAVVAHLDDRMPAQLPVLTSVVKEHTTDGQVCLPWTLLLRAPHPGGFDAPG